MKRRALLALLAAFSVFAALPGPTHAQAQAEVLSADTRLVVFRFDPNLTYPVLARPGVVTHVQLHPGETLRALAVGDSVQWQVQQTGNNIFIKPVKADLFTSATVVTDKRTYQLTLRAGRSDGKWYQRISWEYPDLIVFEAKEAARSVQVAEAERKEAASQTTNTRVPVENLNFGYEISGEAAFRPGQVFDDGRFTWLRLGRSQELPAFFIINDSGEAEIANYLMKGEFMMVQRLFHEGVLKLGRQEVRVRNARARSHGLSGVGGVDAQSVERPVSAN